MIVPYLWDSKMVKYSHRNPVIANSYDSSLLMEFEFSVIGRLWLCGTVEVAQTILTEHLIKAIKGRPCEATVFHL